MSDRDRDGLLFFLPLSLSLLCRISAAVVCQGKPSRCPSPSVPEGVYYAGSRDVGSKIRFQCPEGHMPVGGTESDCLESGEWSSLEPVTCKHVDCGQGWK